MRKQRATSNLRVAVVIPLLERGVLGEEAVANGLREGFRAQGIHDLVVLDERNLELAYAHEADLWLSLSYRFNPAMVIGWPVAFHWNLHSPEKIRDVGQLQYDGYFLNADRLPHDVPCGPMYLLEPGAHFPAPRPADPAYRCRAVYVGNYANRSYEEVSRVLDHLGGEDVAIWGLGAWQDSPWGCWYRGELPADDLLKCYASADFVINVTPNNRREYGMMPMRVVQALACGRAVISDFSPQLAERYGDYVHFYGIESQKKGSADPNVVKDHDWREVAATFLAQFEAVRQAPASSQQTGRKWLWDTRFGTASSLDVFSQHSVLALERRGVDVHVTGSFYPLTPPSIRRIARKRVPVHADVYINVLGSLQEQEKLSRFACSLIYVFWAETMSIQQRDVHYINRFHGALVQSTFSRQSLITSGVAVPVGVFPHGYDPAVFKPVKRPRRPVFTFLQVGIVQKRKGTDLLLRAFVELFGNQKGIRLVIKSRATDLNPHMQSMREMIQREYSKYRNILLIEDDLLDEEIGELYAASDVQVYPSRGEGFAMPLLEGAATGLPVIATAHGGYLDFLNEGNADLIPVNGYTPRDDLGWTHDCLWAEPDYEALKGAMARAYEQRASLPDVGMRLYDSIRDDWTWDRVMERALPAVEALAQQASAQRDPLRRDAGRFRGRLLSMLTEQKEEPIL